MKIAFFDSGIGGLTVFHKALQHFPNHDYVYFADSKNAPYGGRTKEDVKKLTMEAVDFLATKNIDVLVIACHTVSRLMLNKLQALYDFPIIGMQSGMEITDSFEVKKILITGTDLSTEIWRKTLMKNTTNYGRNADFLSLHSLVTLAENFQIGTSTTEFYLRSKLSTYNWEAYHAIVLGCTHFPFFKPKIRAILPNNVRIIDGSRVTIQRLAKYLIIPPKRQISSVEYFVSKKPTLPLFFNRYLDILQSPKPEKYRLDTTNSLSVKCA